MNKQKLIAKSLILIQLATLPWIPSAMAKDPEYQGCSYAKNYPCPDVLAKKTADKEGHAAAYCAAMDNNDSACDATWPIAIGYTAVAVTCGTACFGGPFTAYMEPACEIGSFAVSAADLIVGLVIKGNMDERQKNSKAILAQDWGFIAPAASLAANGAMLGNTALSGGLAYSAGFNGGSLDTAAAASQADAAGSQINANNAAQEASGADNAHYQTAQKSADDAAAESREASSKADKAKAKKKAAMCVAFALNTAMATVKWINFSMIKEDSHKNYNNLCAIQTGECDQPAPVSTVTAPKIASAPQSGGSAGGGGGGGGGGVGKPSANVDLADKANNAATTGKLASSFATAGQGLLDKPSGPAVNKALQAIQQATGVTPGQLAANLEKNGVSATVGAFLPKSDGVASVLAKIDDDAKKYGSMSGATQFASAGMSGSSRGPAAAGGFGSFGANAAPLGGVKDVKFGGFNGDIWHAGTNKTIFEIVSDKTKSVADRVIK